MIATVMMGLTGGSAHADGNVNGLPAANTVPDSTWKASTRETKMKKNNLKMVLCPVVLAAGLGHALAQAQGLPPAPVSPTPVTDYEYDAQGNLTKITRGAGTLNLQTKFSYDPLSRLKQHTDPKQGVTQLQYDGGDRTTQVTDPRSLVTQYPRDGFGNATQLISPDTGTASHTFDEEGNLLTRLDSRGVLATSTYDVINRRTSTVFTKAGMTTQSFA